MKILITGATRGIGAELASQYTARGADIVKTARTPQDGFAQLDVNIPAHHAALASTLGNTALNLLICNAGVYVDKGHQIDTGYAPDLWADTFATNVTGAFLTIQALLPHLERGQGNIAIISSQMASTTHAPGGSYIYRASKAAVLNLGRNLATDLKPKGIAVGIYHPGWVQTDMGGGAAAIDAQTSATGLISRFDALSLATTGCFETWDGRQHPY